MKDKIISICQSSDEDLNSERVSNIEKLVKNNLQEIYDTEDKKIILSLLYCLQIKGFYSVIDPIILFTAKIIKENPKYWGLNEGGVPGERMYRYIVSSIGSAIKVIGLNEELTYKYSEYIIDNIIVASNDSPLCSSFLYALAKNKDARAHAVLKRYLMNSINLFNSDIFKAIAIYKDKDDLFLLEKYIDGNHLDEFNARLHSDAKAAIKKIQN